MPLLSRWLICVSQYQTNCRGFAVGRKMETPIIDTSFDFRTDTPPDKDPDTWSPTLCKYHQLLWSKCLPGGAFWGLSHEKAPFYHYHNSDIGEHKLSSDAVVPSFKYLTNIGEFISEKDLKEFETIGYTIGGMMLFPGNSIERKMTINGARGCHPRIKDRFDLTVECIRRHYLGEWSPLSAVLNRYSDFFKLFDDFRGYVEFFLLQDMVTDDFSAVKFSMPFDGLFDGFDQPPIPTTKEAYLAYKQCAIAFIEARNRRIREWSAIHLREIESIPSST